MISGDLNRFSKLEVLKGIGQSLLIEFLAPFAPDLAAKNISIPNPELPEKDYFAAVSALFASTLNLKPETQNCSPTLDLRPKTSDSPHPQLFDALSTISEMSLPGVAK